MRHRFSCWSQTFPALLIVRTYNINALFALSFPRRKNVPYHRSAAVSLAALLNAFPECCAYELVAPALLDLACLGGSRPDDKKDPIMQARAVSCLAAAWPRTPEPTPMAPETDSTAAAAGSMEIDVTHREAVLDIQRTHAASVVRALSRAVRLKVWSVRVPIFHALAVVVSRSFSSATSVRGGNQADGAAPSSTRVTSVLTGSLLADVVQAVEFGAEDPKYSQVSIREGGGILSTVLAFLSPYCNLGAPESLLSRKHPAADESRVAWIVGRHNISIAV